MRPSSSHRRRSPPRGLSPPRRRSPTLRRSSLRRHSRPQGHSTPRTHSLYEDRSNPTQSPEFRIYTSVPIPDSNISRPGASRYVPTGPPTGKIVIRALNVDDLLDEVRSGASASQHDKRYVKGLIRDGHAEGHTALVDSKAADWIMLRYSDESETLLIPITHNDLTEFNNERARVEAEADVRASMRPAPEPQPRPQPKQEQRLKAIIRAVPLRRIIQCIDVSEGEAVHQLDKDAILLATGLSVPELNRRVQQQLGLSEMGALYAIELDDHETVFVPLDRRDTAEMIRLFGRAGEGDAYEERRDGQNEYEEARGGSGGYHEGRGAGGGYPGERSGHGGYQEGRGVRGRYPGDRGGRGEYSKGRGRRGGYQGRGGGRGGQRY